MDARETSSDSPLLPPGSACPFPAMPPPVAVQLTVLPEHPCAYRPQRMAQSRVVWAQDMPPSVYHRFMDAGFRRSGRLIYQPICKGCRACLPIRVPVATFKPDKSQRRCARRNHDLTVTCGPPAATDEKFDLYTRYVRQWHGGEVEGRSGFEAFLYESPVQTLEFSYRDRAGRLRAVGICDLCPRALSSVYFYFDPAEARRGLGNFGALCEIAFARNQRIPYYYLGYWIDKCRSMQYKSTFRPNEILHPDTVWRSGEAG